MSSQMKEAVLFSVGVSGSDSGGEWRSGLDISDANRSGCCGCGCGCDGEYGWWVVIVVLLFGVVLGSRGSERLVGVVQGLSILPAEVKRDRKDEKGWQPITGQEEVVLLSGIDSING